MTKPSHFSALNTAIRWWCDGLLAWLPESVKQKTKQQAYIQCVIDAEQLIMRRIDKMGKKSDEAVFSLDRVSSNDVALASWLKSYQDDELVLSVSQQQCLIKAITLPAQAQDNVAEMIQFEVDRQTPFSVDQVYVGYHVNDSEGVDKPLSLQLAVIPKKVITPIIEKLAALSLHIKSLQIMSTKVTESAIKIALIDNNKGHSETVDLKRNYFLMALALMLFVALLYSPAIKYENAIEAIQPALTEAKKQAFVVNNLKKDSKLIAGQANFVEDKLATYRSRLDVLEELATILPKHTWLEQSEIKGHILSMRGESSAASDLIALLMDTGHFDAVHFSAATTHNEKTAKERFKIKAVLLFEDKLDGH